MGERGRRGKLPGRDPRGRKALLAALIVATAFVVFPGLSGATPTAVPTVNTDAATTVTNVSATLNGTVNPNDPDTTATYDYTFSWGTTSGGPYPNSGGGSISGGTSDQPVSLPINGLSPDTTYYFNLCATNAADSTDSSCGTELSFTTPDAPTVTTGAATGVTPTGATLNGTVNPNGDPTSYTFEWGTNKGGPYPNSSSPASAGSGSSEQPAQTTISSLTPATTYYYVLCASNDYGQPCGSEQSFFAPEEPTPVTGTASGITTNGATLAGTVNPNGAAVSEAYFNYGPTSGYGSSTSATPSTIPSGRTPVSVQGTLGGLQSGQTFHYQLCATNTWGTDCGGDKTFATYQPPTAALGASPTSGPTPLKVTFDGSGSSDPNPGGSIASWTLDFGDGHSTNGTGTPGSSIQHSYANPCSCTARLTVTGSEGAQDSATQLITVTLNQPPVASLTASPTPATGTVPLAVTFDGSASYDPDGSIASWSLDFGDSSTKATGTGPVPDSIPYTYTAAGTYHAVLTVTDSSNASTPSTPVTVTVNPQPTISVGDVSQNEGNSGTTNFDFPVTLSAISTHDVTVDYATADGTATAGSDYTATSGTLTIPAGTDCTNPASNPACQIPVPVIGNTIYENNETFTLTLSNPTGATIADGVATGTIVDVEPPPWLEAGYGATLEGNSGSKVDPSAGPQTWGNGGNLQLADASGFPYLAGPYTFFVSTPGSPSVSGPYTYHGISHNTLTGVSPAGSVAVGQIAFQPRFITIPVYLCDPLNSPDKSPADCVPITSGLDTSVQYATSDGQSDTTAIPVIEGQDYVYAAGTLTIPAGQSSGSITFETIPNTTLENPNNPEDDLTRWFNVNLSNPTNGTIASKLGIAKIIEDDGLNPPMATTGPCSAIGTDTATIAATVNPNGDATSVYVQYGPTDSYGNPTGRQSLPAGNSAQQLSFPLTGLSPNTTYHYQVFATHLDTHSTGYGQDKICKTLPTSPKLSAVSASALAPTKEKVSVTVDPNGAQTKTWVEYGTSKAYGASSATQTIPAGPAKTLTFTLTGLKACTTYYYDIVAQHTTDSGHAATDEETFSTLCTKPMRLKLKGRVFMATANGVVPLPFHCSGNSASRCNGKALLENGSGRPVGFKAFSTRPNHTKLVRIALKRTALRQLRANVRLHLWLLISVGVTDQPAVRITVRS